MGLEWKDIVRQPAVDFATFDLGFQRQEEENVVPGERQS